MILQQYCGPDVHFIQTHVYLSSLNVFLSCLCVMCKAAMRYLARFKWCAAWQDETVVSDQKENFADILTFLGGLGRIFKSIFNDEISKMRTE